MLNENGTSKIEITTLPVQLPQVDNKNITGTHKDLIENMHYRNVLIIEENQTGYINEIPVITTVQKMCYVAVQVKNGKNTQVRHIYPEDLNDFFNFEDENKSFLIFVNTVEGDVNFLENFLVGLNLNTKFTIIPLKPSFASEIKQARVINSLNYVVDELSITVWSEGQDFKYNFEFKFDS